MQLSTDDNGIRSTNGKEDDDIVPPIKKGISRGMRTDNFQRSRLSQCQYCHMRRTDDTIAIFDGYIIL